MEKQPPKQEPAEAECRYRCLRAAVADYQYHVRIEGGRVVEKIHGPNCEAITGYKPEEYIANPLLWFEIVLEDDRSVVERQTAQVLSDQQASAVEYRIRRKDGQLRWILKTVVPYRDAQGQVIAYDSLLRDITSGKQAAESLRESEERFRLLFEDDFTGDYLAAPDGTILLCNQAFVEIFGFNSREEAVGSSLANLYVAPLSWPRFIQLLLDNKALERYERTSRHSDGTIRHVIETVLGTFNAQGELLRIKGYVFDDTVSKLATTRMQRRNAELEEVVSHRTQALREKHEHLEAIWNSAFDAIITIDSQGRIETANRAAEKMFGYSNVEMIGQNVKILMPSPFREEHDGYLRHYLETGEARILNIPRELVARRKDGSTFPIDLSVTQVDHSGYFTGIIRDISERKELQAHVLESAAEEQRRIGRELHDGTGQELTALSLIAGSLLKLIAAVPAKETEGHVVRQLDEAGFVRICDIANKLNRKLSETNRDIHQLSHGIMPVQIDAEALRSALDELAASTNTPPTVSCRFECPLPVMAANNTTATHLYRIAQEAVNNALRHSQADEICISLRQNDDQIVLEVSDNGVGIDAVDSRVATVRKDRGMGLRTMQYRAGMIGGTLHIERRESGGTLVRCVSLFPRVIQ
ncbi:Sensor protein FixL [Anatilimnocola aggregata]|uniref:Sensor protein FixL n=1 Tax=Anatilimnocola aggregata TaxID=2528021 RepID=A0A517YGA5_9BACT|nr:PAS domain S-box protein [Anatilimnocola aggregata]QDU29258.1 Sensor protein FixL [Anatilimnocola aggregata]